MISKNLGFRPKTRDELLRLFLDKYKDIVGDDSITFLQFQGSNVHNYANILYDEYDALYSMFVDLYTRQFDYWITINNKISGALGSSYEGWINRFVNHGLCDGIDIINSEDSRAKLKWTSATDKLLPGEIVVYFDNLKETDKSPAGELHLAFLQCKNVAEPLRHGLIKMDLYFSNGRKLAISYNNLEVKDYTNVDIKVVIEYDEDAIQYPPSFIEEKIKEAFNQKVSINKNLYPQSLFCASNLNGLKTVKVTSKLSSQGESEYKEDIIIASLGEKGQKYALNKVVVSQ